MVSMLSYVSATLRSTRTLPLPYENGAAELLGSGAALDRYRSFLRYEIVSSLAPAPELPFSQRPWGPTLPCPAPLAMVSGSPHPDWV